MRVTTKKYQLENNQYIGVATKALLRKEWQWSWIPALLLALAFVFYKDAFWWFLSLAILTPFIYLLFWGVQFAGVTQHEAGKFLFYKMSYQIDGKQLLLMVDKKHGMPVEWKNFKYAFKNKKGFVLAMSKAQIIYLPLTIFKSDSDIRLTETILKRKGLLK
jgi:hypothetical protein